ncbi:UbiA family prenyltransferase [Ruminococcus sp.]|uniref:UbiA family prenyltransferase n=1 Tax=Ruminococcus sp. TaxID=41978 RepID=UPI001B422A9C|nr:UbiA family prenyltransferase [Ruminococcus sp.]MBP5431663.1 UbiA family prenyltransferase [Ruminococcus sp.]
MLKRLDIYFKEMYPLLPRLLLGFIVFGEIYFIVLLNNGITNFSISLAEFIGGFTVFSFLCWLRIADDFKDYELDCRLFSQRPLPSGRVTKKDLAIFITSLIAVTVMLNLIFLNNFMFFLFLYIYGTLMSLWFFQKKKIQKSLPLALVTHNPVQMILNIYIISFTCIKYGLSAFTLTNFLAMMTLYFPALIWEISRKIRAPKDETEYITYSKLFGYKKPVRFVLILTIVDIITNILLVYRLSMLSVAALLINTAWMTYKFVEFMDDPTKFKLVDKVEKYTYIQESIMLITVAVYIISNKSGVMML